MKRKAYTGQYARKSNKRRKIAGSYAASVAPRRTYRGSMVPLRSYGYRPNRVERKVNDVAEATYQVNTTGSFTLLANPAVGADFNNRIGRKVLLKSAYIRGYVRTEESSGLGVVTTGSQIARMIIFADLQPNGATPLVADLLTQATPTSHLNLNNRDRFKIYCDKEYAFDPAVLGASFVGLTNQIRLVKKYKKINLEMIFSTSTGAIADVTSGALYMFWIGSQASGTNTDINAVVSTRVRYSDV